MADHDKRKLVLIADPDRAVLKALGNALHGRGYEVRAARDGSQALEKAILVHPDLVLFDDRCPLISAKKYIQILRSNPRTEHIPVIVMTEGEAEDSLLWGYREAVIRKPFHADEVLALLATIFRRMATARVVREEGRQIEGSLGQIGLVDLLQIFALNRKTGLLEVRAEGQEGRIHVAGGGVVRAALGRLKGEKALFRLLGWRQGSFAFIPEQTTHEINVRRGTEMLLLEAARQADELERLRAELPGERVRLKVVPEKKAQFEGLHPVTEELLALLEFYGTVGELMDHARVTDFEACRAIRTLLDRGLLVAAEELLQAPDEAPLLPPEALFELKVRLAQDGLPAAVGVARHTRGKVVLVSADPRALRELVSGLGRVAQVELDGQLEALRVGFGRLGALRLSEHLLIELVLLPFAAALRPLWVPLGERLAGALVLRGQADDSARFRLNLMVSHLRDELGVPVMQLVPVGVEPPPGAVALDASDSAQVRGVVGQLLERMRAAPARALA
jgi:CheY-like chemotaxis protein